MNRRNFTGLASIGAAAAVLSQTSSATTNVGTSNASSLLIAGLDAVRKADSRDAAFHAWLDVVKQRLPFLQATALVSRPSPEAPTKLGAVRRVFSTIPSAYPVGGWKQLSGSDWARKVLERGEVLVANSDVELQHYFPDHELLKSLGTNTLVNIPVVVCKRSVGAFALLCSQLVKESAITEEIHLLSALAAPLFSDDLVPAT
jgi:hypothetical protein